VQRAIANEGELFHRSGDEIITLLPNLNSSDSSKVAERIRAAIEQKPFSVIGQGFVTVTIGSATYPDNCDRWEYLEERADETLSQAKKIRKNWVLVAENAG
jgi:diguanylate cyclase (GGDEF)-like protein